MHYYQFNIGDYASHTSHLDEIEDLAYRRMIDYCYLNEIGLPESPDEVGRLIRMRTHSECIANVLREFFTLHDDGFWRNNRVEAELQAFRDKSGKAKKAARKRWDKANADALQTHSERNAKHKPITNNQEPREGGSVEPDAGKPASSRGQPLVTLQGYIDRRKAEGQKPIPKDHSVFAYAADAGIPQEFLTLAWHEFKSRYTTSPDDRKKYRDWPGVFLKAVKGNWLKVWYLEGGMYKLTTVGQQAELARGNHVH